MQLSKDAPVPQTRSRQARKVTFAASFADEYAVFIVSLAARVISTSAAQSLSAIQSDAQIRRKKQCDTATLTME